MNVSTTHKYSANLETSNNLWVLGTVIAIMVYCIGTYINWKIISVCRKVKDKTWQIDIAHSVGMMIAVLVIVIFEKVSDQIAVLSEYTGTGVCYLTSSVYTYSAYLGGFHSFSISLVKYAFIVHNEKVRRYGEEKLRKIFFWGYVLHPLMLTIPTVILLDFEVFSSLIHCFGLQEELIDRYRTSDGFNKMFLCKLGLDEEETETSFSYILKQSFCSTKMIWVLVLSSNIPEGYMYFRIFRFMKR